MGYDNDMGESRLLSLPQSLQYRFLVLRFHNQLESKGQSAGGDYSM